MQIRPEQKEGDNAKKTELQELGSQLYASTPEDSKRLRTIAIHVNDIARIAEGRPADDCMICPIIDHASTGKPECCGCWVWEFKKDHDCYITITCNECGETRKLLYDRTLKSEPESNPRCKTCNDTGEFYDAESGDGTGADMKKPCKVCRKKDYQEFQEELRS